MVNTQVQIGSLILNNPVIAASGTFGFGREMDQWNDLSKIGGISSKGLTLAPRLGNDPVRVAETSSGMLNSVGLQNPGIQAFIDHELPFMQSLGTTVIANIAGHSLEENVRMASLLDQTAVNGIELNLSCPNVNQGCMAFGSSSFLIEEVVRAVRAQTKKPLWVKLTPNVTSISEMALAAEAAGADAVSLINTLLGLAVDRKTRRPVLRNNTGGLSGPAVKPVALRMVWEVSKAVKIPVVGMGGIMTGEDAIEFMLAGATAVQVGTANLISPTACHNVVLEMINISESENMQNIRDYTGQLNPW